MSHHSITQMHWRSPLVVARGSARHASSIRRAGLRRAAIPLLCALGPAIADVGHDGHWSNASTPLDGPSSLGLGPQQEWLRHKTSDGRHPNAQEQALVWLMNRARRSPGAEGQWLASCVQPEVAAGRDHFGVDVALLRREFSHYEPKPPAAFDARLYTAARGHAQALIARDGQDHHRQLERVDQTRFDYDKLHGSVMSYAENPVNGHAALNIDWAQGSPDGMDPDRKHRVPIMGVDGHYSHVGIAALSETDPTTQVGPLVIAADYARIRADGVQRFDRFLVGTVWSDHNGNERYDPGEGHPGIKVEPDHGPWYAITAAGGGYALPVTQPGRYQVRFSGAGVGALLRETVIREQSVALDCLPDERVAEAEPLQVRVLRSHRPSIVDSALPAARTNALVSVYPQVIEGVHPRSLSDLPLAQASFVRADSRCDF